MVASRQGGFRERRVAVVGLGRSNAAVLRYLCRCGARIEGYDRRPEGELALPPLPGPARLACGPDYLERLGERLDGLAAIFVTPGMRKDAAPLRAAAAAGIPLWTEAAYVLEVAPAPVVGITGSAGKTTTTTLVGDVVCRFRPGSLVGGNIGVPLLDRLEDLRPGAWLVMELSSFQLELCRTSPAVAALLNLRPNHLDVHGSMEAYADAKRRVYRFQRPGDWAVFGLDDAGSAALAPEAPAGRLGFSGRGPVAAGAGVERGAVCWYPPRDAGPAREGGPAPWRWGGAVCPLAAVRVPGQHNVENVAAAAAVALAAGAPPDLVAAAVAAFRGVAHRQELVREWRGIRFVNDSIATTPDRCAAALHAWGDAPLILLLGGYDKGIPFAGLAEEIAHGPVERVVVFGATAGPLQQAIAAAGAGAVVERAENLDAAFRAALDAASPGRTVLLSPACASYDQFRDFEERGERFRALVAALPD
jgi:UDP-N-acetylmuramoylalanine--D-glutamate ligase